MRLDESFSYVVSDLLWPSWSQGKLFFVPLHRMSNSVVGLWGLGEIMVIAKRQPFGVLFFFFFYYFLFLFFFLFFFFFFFCCSSSESSSQTGASAMIVAIGSFQGAQCRDSGVTSRCCGCDGVWTVKCMAAKMRRLTLRPGRDCGGQIQGWLRLQELRVKSPGTRRRKGAWRLMFVVAEVATTTWRETRPSSLFVSITSRRCRLRQ